MLCVTICDAITIFSILSIIDTHFQLPFTRFSSFHSSFVDLSGLFLFLFSFFFLHLFPITHNRIVLLSYPVSFVLELYLTLLTSSNPLDFLLFLFLFTYSILFISSSFYIFSTNPSTLFSPFQYFLRQCFSFTFFLNRQFSYFEPWSNHFPIIPLTHQITI